MEKKEWKSKWRNLVERHVPCSQWMPRYRRDDAVSDLIAGITISLTMIPQSIAYASLADLPPQTGLNSAFMGCVVYVFFGTIKEVVIGPTSLMALLTYSYTHSLHTLDFVVLLCFLCGVVELAMGLLRLGFLVDFIPAPVVSGFTSATSIIIVVSQIKGILGIRFKSRSFIENIEKLYNGWPMLKSPDIVLGVSCIIALLTLRSIKFIKVSEKSTGKKLLSKFLWFLSTGRNALVVLVTSWIAYKYERGGQAPPFLVTHEVKSGLPSIMFPPTTTVVNNRTYNFPDMVQELGTGIFVIPIVSVLANVAIAKAYTEGGVDGTQEMLTLAMCNIAGSLVQSMPTCGAFTRSAVISASGVRTPLAGLYSAGLTLLSLKYLAAYFHLIPRATLSAILISAVIFLFDYQIFKPLWKSSKSDLLLAGGTLLCCLGLGVESGLLLGALGGSCRLLYHWARPPISHVILSSGTEGGGVGCIQVTPELGMTYPAADYVPSYVLKVCSKYSTEVVAIDCTNFTLIDQTAVKGLHGLSKTLDKKGLELIFINVPQNMIQIWKCSGFGNLNILSSDEFERRYRGLADKKCKTTTLSLIEESVRRAGILQEGMNLLEKTNDHSRT